MEGVLRDVRSLLRPNCPTNPSECPSVWEIHVHVHVLLLTSHTNNIVLARMDNACRFSTHKKMNCSRGFVVLCSGTMLLAIVLLS